MRDLFPVPAGSALHPVGRLNDLFCVGVTCRLYRVSTGRQDFQQLWAVPMVNLRANFEELHAAGCIQTGADSIPDAANARLRFHDLLHGLMFATNGDPCNGCPAYNGGKCAAFQKFNVRAKGTRPAPRHDDAPTRIVLKCKSCGCRIRGSNHAEGRHHLAAVKAKR